MKKGDTKSITIPTGRYNEYEKIDAEFLGRGQFATCYRVNDVVYSFVRYTNNTDYSKQGIGNYADKENLHIPQIESLGDSKCRNYEIFKMPFYKNLTKESKKAWEQAKFLKTELNNAWLIYKKSYNYFEGNFTFINSLRGKIEDSIIDGLESINQALHEYSEHYTLEFQTRNLKVDSDGNLIFLDVIFNAETLRNFNK